MIVASATAIRAVRAAVIALILPALAPAPSLAGAFGVGATIVPMTFTGNVKIGARGPGLVPRSGLIHLDSGVEEFSALINEGRFTLPYMRAGAYVARIDYQGGSCQTALRVPAPSQMQTNLGVVTCP
jgi:hypothetical protein